jgi:cation-transporting ATPase 13A3/4/5
MSQTIYIPTEDLTIAVAGFITSRIGYTIYLAASSLTLGLGWLVLRWFPRTRMRLIGKACPLRECNWVVIEACIHRLGLIGQSNYLRTNGMSLVYSK